jgi:hypothetical protein
MFCVKTTLKVAQCNVTKQTWSSITFLDNSFLRSKSILKQSSQQEQQRQLTTTKTIGPKSTLPAAEISLNNLRDNEGSRRFVSQFVLLKALYTFSNFK